MRSVDEIDDDLWLVSVIRRACQRDGGSLPHIRRANDLLDERLATRVQERLPAVGGG